MKFNAKKLTKDIRYCEELFEHYIKNNPIKLDLKDRKILYELDINARQSASEIGKKVGLSKQVVTYRINKLIES